MNKETLEQLAELSHEFGGPRYVLGGGGNTSFKDHQRMWIKPSGMTLAQMTPRDFVEIDRAKLVPLYSWTPPADPAEREAGVKDLMMAARAEGQNGRPSVETPLHDAFDAPWVVHTHPPLVNGMTCGMDGQAAAAELFPDAQWLPYIDPGYTLSMEVRRRLDERRKRDGTQPSIVFLENHGVIVAGSSPQVIMRTYERVLAALEGWYRKQHVPYAPPVIDSVMAGELNEINQCVHDAFDREMAVVAAQRFETATGPLTPDHMVYAGAQPMDGPLTGERIQAFTREHGCTPRIVRTEQHILAIADTQQAADLAFELTVDGAHVLRLTRAFGGVRYMSDDARRFIENWEVEAYRQQVAVESTGR
ncbi:MAG: class II aldolase [Phycisphaeraceae bacterium]|nr:class II aldolase [Phycisphaeraceae bacterium]